LLGLVGSGRVRSCQACADRSALVCRALGEERPGEAGGCRRDGREGDSEPGGASTFAAPGYSPGHRRRRLRFGLLRSRAGAHPGRDEAVVLL